MADTERSLLYVTLGFLGALFIMKSVRVLRPASASSMSNLSCNDSTNLCKESYPDWAERQKIFGAMGVK